MSFTLWCTTQGHCYESLSVVAAAGKSIRPVARRKGNSDYKAGNVGSFHTWGADFFVVEGSHDNTLVFDRDYIRSRHGIANERVPGRQWPEKRRRSEMNENENQI
ncbi:hypothetical protein V6N13_049557 [Hibiscus sabdariffa]